MTSPNRVVPDPFPPLPPFSFPPPPPRFPLYAAREQRRLSFSSCHRRSYLEEQKVPSLFSAPANRVLNKRWRSLPPFPFFPSLLYTLKGMKRRLVPTFPFLFFLFFSFSRYRLSPQLSEAPPSFPPPPQYPPQKK